MLEVKSDLERSLQRIMARTERLALTSDRNGMLMEKHPESTALGASDVRHYLGLQRVARHLKLEDVMEYWKSAPYLLNFMEEYELKRKMRDALDLDDQDPEFVRAMRQASSDLLAREEIERYGRLDPANARMRGLHTTDGFLDIDNNIAERALRQIAVGRKNWLFAGSAAGAETAATLFSVTSSCHRHGIDVFAYLRDVLEHLAHAPNPTPEQLRDWLPIAGSRRRKLKTRDACLGADPTLPIPAHPNPPPTAHGTGIWQAS